MMTSSRGWLVAAFALVVVAAAALRWGTSILDKDEVFDERYIRQPIDDLITRGWTVETAIDYTETKGPAMIWPYAALGGALGGDLDDLRLVSVGFFVLGAVPLLALARRCGTAGPDLVLVAAFYVLLPQLPVLGQVVMSEPSFACTALWLAWAFVWGFGRDRGTQHAVAGPIVVAVLLSVLVHNRIHGAAYGAAIALMAVQRDGRRGWPWVAAVAAAAASRVPLLLRWGGLVAPAYQSAHGLGLGLASLAYLAAALVPMLAILLWPAWLDVRYRCRRGVVYGCAAAGVALAVIATPDLGETVTILDLQPRRYLGLVAHAVGDVVPAGLQGVALVGLAGVGLAALGALAVIAHDRSTREPIAVVERLQLWTLAAGWGMYLLTSSVVYDRYLVAWAVLMPIVWVHALPRRALLVQAVILAAVQAWLVYRLLM